MVTAAQASTHIALEDQGKAARLHPGFNTTFSNQPYYAVAMRHSGVAAG